MGMQQQQAQVNAGPGGGIMNPQQANMGQMMGPRGQVSEMQFGVGQQSIRQMGQRQIRPNQPSQGFPNAPPNQNVMFQGQQQMQNQGKRQ